MPYFVSRQHYWDNGDYGVEIVRDLDDASPDMLVAKYPDEGEYDDPRDAVEAAIKIRDAWQADMVKDGGPDYLAPVVGIYGFTTGHGLVAPEEVPSDKHLRAWAKKEWAANVRRCDQCGQIITKKRPVILFGDDSWSFCGQSCADEYARDYDGEVEED
ncbi:MAG TPA: hypothetical protein VH593_10185 [Ktedonobacteraceae bacterium]